MRSSDSTKVRPLVILAFAVIGTVVGILGWVYLASSNLKWIAHALGGIDDKDYTNSIEAFEANLKKGFSVFEIDLMLTADDEICAFHNLESMEKELGLTGRFFQLEKKKFLQQKIFGKYQPVCLEQFTALAKKNPDVFFVLDIKDSRNLKQEQDLKVYEEAFKRIYQKLFRAWAESPELWTRMIPQIYQEKDLEFLKSFYRFRSVIYTLYRTKASDDQVNVFVKKYPEISAVAVDRKRFSESLARQMKQLKRDLFVYTVNDPKEIKEFVKKGASGFYTDFHEPVAHLK